VQNTLTFKIVTPEGVTFEDTVHNVTVPTQSGEVGIYANHAPLISLVVPGELVIKKTDETIYLSVAHGVLEVRKGNKVIIIADQADHATEIDVEGARKAIERAEGGLEKGGLTTAEVETFEKILEAEEAKIKVAENHYQREK